MRTERHEAIIKILIDHCGLMDATEEDENQPILSQVMQDEESAAEYLLSVIRQATP